jgi:DeoR family transcriptional regulator, fructose operon transcriptional repressor
VPQHPLRYTGAAARRQRIVRQVRETGFASPAALAHDLGVHEMTIRRDLRLLADEGLVHLVHGGASLPRGAALGSPYRERAGSSRAAKAAIGSAALGYLRHSAAVGLDSGTTVAELARRLPDDADLTVVTHSLTAMAELGNRTGMVLIGLGGLYNATSRSFAGPETRTALSQLQLDVLFLSASALSRDGVFCANPFEAETKRTLLRAAARVVVLADASKLIRSAPARICGLERITAVVTDARIRPEDRTWLEPAVTDLRIVPDRLPR